MKKASRLITIALTALIGIGSLGGCSNDSERQITNSEIRYALKESFNNYSPVESSVKGQEFLDSFGVNYTLAPGEKINLEPVPNHQNRITVSVVHQNSHIHEDVGEVNIKDVRNYSDSLEK